MDTVAWLVVAVVMLIGEMICPIFFMFWFAIGALVALIVSLITSNILVQAVVFLGVSVTLVAFTKPLTKKFFNSKAKDELNINGIIGKKALVTKTIDNLNGTGEIKVHGEIWSATSKDDAETIEEGNQVEILEVEGVKVIVKNIDDIENKD